MDNVVPKKTRDLIHAPVPGISAAAVIVAIAIAAFGCSPRTTNPTTKSVASALHVLVRPADRTIEPILVSEPGALPVVSGGAMSIDVELAEPAFIYLVWINPDGEIVPLYPWNNEMLEVTDIKQPPPVRRATKRIFSPLLGRSWTFGTTGGAETVILLTRRTALPEDVAIGELLKSPTMGRLERPTDLREVCITHDGAGKPAWVETKGIRDGDPVLTDHLRPLAEHFDYIQAVQFAHEDKKPE